VPDPRIAAVLHQLGEDHELTVSATSDHEVDITAIDGQPVNVANTAARAVATQLQELDAAIRPDEVGTPWAIAAPGYFTDADHQAVLHIGFRHEPADVEADPRLVALLSHLGERHKLTVSATSDHGADITAIDGRPVNVANAAARELATQLRQLDATMRPDAVGTPWAINAPGYFTDGAHQDRLHVAFQLERSAQPTTDVGHESLSFIAAVEGDGRGPGARALAALAEARKHLGTPRQRGGSTPQTRFDSSGLVQWSYAQAGIQLPRAADQQSLAGTAVGRDQLLPGDLVLVDDDVGLSLGGAEFIHVGEAVEIASLDEHRFTGARRLDRAGARAAPDPTEVAKAQARVARDAAELRRLDAALFAHTPLGLGDDAPEAELAERAGLPRELPAMQSALETKQFIARALAVKRERIAAGDVNFGQDPAQWEQWIRLSLGDGAA
jgi:cell wall-associated NlpC family hydrolase